MNGAPVVLSDIIIIILHMENDSLFYEVREVLKEDPRLVADENLLENKLIELTHDSDEKLIEKLYSSNEIRESFFTETDETSVFNKEQFLKFITSKEFLGSSYTKFRNKIGMKNDSKFIDETETIELSWPYKDCVLEGGQTDVDEQRAEKFWNESLEPQYVNTLKSPKVFTNFSKYDDEGVKDIDSISKNDNIFVRGNNLLALHSLTSRYRGNVKLIYIDPPYNTGNDSFKYNDNFSSSTWLTFMKNRLEVAKELLSDDGVIVAQISDESHPYLRLLMDEIFGEDRFLNSVSVQMRNKSGQIMANTEHRIPRLKEYLLMYGNENFSFNDVTVETDKWDDEYKKILENFSEEDYRKINDWEEGDGLEDIESILKDVKLRSLSDKMEELGIEYNNEEWKKENSYRIVRTSSSSSVKNLAEREESYKNSQDVAPAVSTEGTLYLIDTEYTRDVDYPRIQVVFSKDNLQKPIGDIWTDISTSSLHSEGGITLKNGKKPEKLLKRIIELTTDSGDRVLDFFLGSGTTAAVAHKMRRKYIGIEQLNYGDNDPTVRLQKVIRGEDNTGVTEELNWTGGGEFTYMELKKLNHEFIDSIESSNSSDELVDIYENIVNNAFLSYRVDLDNAINYKSYFISLDDEDKKRVLVDMLDKNQLYLNYTEIDDENHGLKDKDEKRLNKEFYGDNNE